MVSMNRIAMITWPPRDDSQMTNRYMQQIPIHYEYTPIQIYRKFHLQKLKISG